MSDYNYGSHTVHDIKYHFVWLAAVGSVTKETIQQYISNQFGQGDSNHFKIEDEEFQS